MVFETGSLYKADLQLTEMHLLLKVCATILSPYLWLIFKNFLHSTCAVCGTFRLLLLPKSGSLSNLGARLLASKLRPCSCLHIPQHWCSKLEHGCAAGNSSSELHALAAGALPTQPAPQPKQSNFLFGQPGYCKAPKLSMQGLGS